jgi:succinate dehydrogenase/fumarate reductase cytochrome b subunit
MFHLVNGLHQVLWDILYQGDHPAGVHEASAIITNIPVVLLFACIVARQDDDRVIQVNHGLLS